MSGNEHATLVIRQDDAETTRLVLENILAEGKRSGIFDPFVIEAGYTEKAVDRQSTVGKSGLSHYVKTTGPDGIPWTDPEGFLACVAKMGRKRQARLLNDKEFFILASPGALNRIAGISGNLWLFLAPDSLSSTLVYRLLSHYKKEGDPGPTISMWYMGMRSIEKAAQEHLRIHEQLSKLLPGSDHLVFAGAIGIDRGKADLASAYGIPLIDMFSGDSFHGSIKAALKRVEMRRSADEGDEAEGAQRLRKGINALRIEETGA